MCDDKRALPILARLAGAAAGGAEPLCRPRVGRLDIAAKKLRALERRGRRLDSPSLTTWFRLLIERVHHGLRGRCLFCADSRPSRQRFRTGTFDPRRSLSVRLGNPLTGRSAQHRAGGFAPHPSRSRRAVRMPRVGLRATFGQKPTAERLQCGVGLVRQCRLDKGTVRLERRRSVAARTYRLAAARALNTLQPFDRR
jgi:hypothetical protein